TIQDELGGAGQEQEVQEMREKAEKMKWNAEINATFLKELNKLGRTHSQSPDYSVQLNYLQTILCVSVPLCSIPFSTFHNL
ncbi:Lon protease, partial [termite gut metagenome]